METTIALAGNPNAGKTTLFNELTGARQHVGNYPGVTVEKRKGRISTTGIACTLWICREPILSPLTHWKRWLPAIF